MEPGRPEDTLTNVQTWKQRYGRLEVSSRCSDVEVIQRKRNTWRDRELKVEAPCKCIDVEKWRYGTLEISRYAASAQMWEY